MMSSLAHILKPGIRTIECLDEAQWLSTRGERIGASNAAIICDLSNWGSRFSLAHELLGLEMPRQVDEDQSYFTHAMEPLIANWYSVQTGHAVIDPGRYTVWVNDAYPAQGATLDYIAYAGKDRGYGVLQIKTWNPFRKKDWANGIPTHIKIQVQQEMLCSGLEWGVVVVYFDTTDVRIFEMEANERFQVAIAEECDRFMADLAQGILPEPDAHPATKEALKALAPEDDGSIIDLGLQGREWFERIEQLEAEIDPLEKELEATKNRVRNAIGKASFATSEDYGYQFTYKKDSDGKGSIVLPLESEEQLKSAGILYNVVPGRRGARKLLRTELKP